MIFNISEFKNTPTEIAKLQDVFLTLSTNPQVMQNAWEELNAYFLSNPVGVDRKYFLSLFRWYTDLTWSSLNNLPREIMVEMVCSRQIPMAILLDFDVLRLLVQYLGFRSTDDVAMKSMYSDMRITFLGSEAIVGTLSQKNFTQQEVIELVKIMQLPSATSIQVAETTAKIQSILFSETGELFNKYFFIEPEVAVDRYIDTINFFLGVKPERIWDIVDPALHPDKYEQLLQDRLGSIPTSQSSLESVYPSDENKSEIKSNGLKLSHAQIKTALEAEFPQDASGQFVDAEGVLNKLASYAEAYNDAMILDLYYYNEADGKFHWNDDLLNS